MASFTEQMIIGIAVLFALAGPHLGFFEAHAAQIETGSFPERWINGTTEDEPALQVHLFSERTWIFRQSVLTHFEAPFLYLLAGEQEALLLDTGATTDVPVRQIVDDLIGDDFPLVVAHSHAHGDHVAGDDQFRTRSNTRIVGHSWDDVASLFGISDWPLERGVVHLGGRDLSILAIPGHEPSSIAIYDFQTGLLLTGDTLYPGRLYVRDFEAFRQSIDRLVAFTTDNDVSWVLGTHIEMTTSPGVDFEFRASSHPSERSLQLTRRHLLELQAALAAMGGTARRAVHDDFIIFPVD